MKLKDLEMTLLRGLFVKIAPQPAYAFAMSSEAHDSCTWADCEGDCFGCPGLCKGDCKNNCPNTCNGKCQDDCSGEAR